MNNIPYALEVKIKEMIKSTQIDHVKDVLKEVLDFSENLNVIGVFWHTDDVMSRAESLDIDITEEKAFEILEIIKENHDCEQGINWDVVDYYLNDYNGE